MIQVLPCRWKLTVSCILGWLALLVVCQPVYGQGLEALLDNRLTATWDDPHDMRANLRSQNFLLVPFYATCPDSCSLLAPQLNAVLQRMPKSERPQILGVSLDPSDSIDDFTNFRKRFHLDGRQWILVSMNRFEMQRLFQDISYSYVQEGPRTFSHPTRFYRVSQGGRKFEPIEGLNFSSRDLKGENAVLRAFINPLTSFVGIILVIAVFLLAFRRKTLL